jgi:hypothetical protein
MFYSRNKKQGEIIIFIEQISINKFTKSYYKKSEFSDLYKIDLINSKKNTKYSNNRSHSMM